MGPGPRNLLTDVAGIKVGNAEDPARRTGVTVVVPDQPAVAAVDVRGGAPGTRETDALDPTCVVDGVHGIVLSGGSAFGLDAAGGLQGWLAARGRGFRVGPAVVPIVPSAILFDLLNGGDKDWGDRPPFRDLARQAADAAGDLFALGNAGAGLGATAGSLKGGLGSASLVADFDGAAVTVAALVAANPAGSTVMPGQSSFWAWALERDGELGGQPAPSGALADLDYEFRLPGSIAKEGANTTLAVVATDARLDKAQARRVAIMAHDGFARAIRPVHTPLDGDTAFALATGAVDLPNPVAGLARLGMMAADCVARAVARGVYEADSLGDFPSYRAEHGHNLGHATGREG
ncbi:MAG: P1 family peptidase [Hyphomicrobiales bacterium]|nr:P1 family peptidase [Hyphomicrobiales bacterium]MCP5373930.1 P1 family peptidase [Hyphomicrobiales bacterium]